MAIKAHQIALATLLASATPASPFGLLRGFGPLVEAIVGYVMDDDVELP